MSLSVCLLTRNQEQTIARALRSVAGLADQVVVADTASADGTAQLAAELGAEVCQFPWDDDFAAGRNFAIQRATGDWVLWLNADEELQAASHQAVRDCLSRADVFGYFVRLQNPVAADRPGDCAETSDLRLFRRRPDLRFVGRCHPGFDPTLGEAVQRDGQQVLLANVILRSSAYLAERSESKLRWTAHLLELELRDRPGQLHSLIEYGRTLLRLQDPKGHAVLAEATEQILAARAAAAAPSRKVQALLEYVLTVSPELSRSRLSRDEARALALRWFPHSPRLLYLNAEHNFRAGRWRQAAQLLETLVQLGDSGASDRSAWFDPGLIGEDALINLGACYRRLGELDRAELCYRRLLPSRRFSAQALQALAAVQNARAESAASGKARPQGWFSFDITDGGRS